MKYTDIFFDFDGTLADTVSGITFACNKVFENHGINKRYDDAKIITFIGEGSKKLFLRAFEFEDLNEENNPLYEEFLYYYLNCQTEHLKLYKNVKETLKTLQNLNISLYIYSNKPHNILVECVKLTLPEINFKLVLGNNTNEKPKPDPEVINKFIEENNIDKSTTAYVGDSIVDLRFANNLKVDSIILSWGYWNTGNIKEAKIDYLLDDIGDILNI